MPRPTYYNFVANHDWNRLDVKESSAPDLGKHSNTMGLRQDLI